MPPELRQRFERLLLDHTLWEQEGVRRARLGSLRAHEIWDDLDLKGSPAEAADKLLNLYGKHGPEPFLMVLSTLREGRPIRTISRTSTRSRLHWGRGGHACPGTVCPTAAYTTCDLKHAPIFFGRDGEVDRLIRTLTTTEQGRRFAVVVGASGAGKSSLVRAGLWARLAAGQVPELPGSESWLISAMNPLELGGPEASAALLAGARA